MSDEFKPGDVALVEVGGKRDIALLTTDGGEKWWELSSGRVRAEDAYDLEIIRRLVVIDPEDDEQVNHLADLLHDHAVRDALREYASPTPPRPDEPMGLGAVVEDAQGEKWVRVSSEDVTQPWRKADVKPGRARVCAWREISPKTVHDHGWLPEGVQR